MDVHVPSGLEVRLAETRREVEGAQSLRYEVFYREAGIEAPPLLARAQRDVDAIDRRCDHLIALSRHGGSVRVVGTYRLLRRTVASREGGFFTESRFDLGPVLAQRGELLELGRACVHRDFRTRGVMQVLWRGVARYIREHDVRLMFGCASFQGAQVAGRQRALSYLYHHHLAPEGLRAIALGRGRVSMNLLPAHAVASHAEVRELPPLLKGYVRLGCHVGDGAVIDRELDQLDVCVVLETDGITERYNRHYLDERAVEQRVA